MQGSIKERIRKKGIDATGKERKNVKVYDVYFRYTDPVTGKRKSTSKRGFRTKSEAQAFLLDLNIKLQQNSYLPPKSMTTREYLLEWLKSYGGTNLRRSTYDGYERIIRRHLVPHLGNYEIRNLKAVHIDEMYAFLLREGRADGNGGLAGKSVQYTHRVLNEALEHAVKKQIIYHNPVKGTSAPKAVKYRGKILNVNEILLFLEAAKGTCFEIPIALAAICGLRRGECLALTVEDIDFENQMININKQMIDLGKEVFIERPKSEDSNRVISAPPEVFAMIRRHLGIHRQHKEALLGEYEDHELLVCQVNGKPYRPSSFSKSFTEMLKKKELKKIRFHDLRHSCASLMLTSGVAMKTASQILGHSSIAITADLYTHILEDVKKDAADQIGGNLFKKQRVSVDENQT